jgi:hypothetical protein
MIGSRPLLPKVAQPALNASQARHEPQGRGILPSIASRRNLSPGSISPMVKLILTSIDAKLKKLNSPSLAPSTTTLGINGPFIAHSQHSRNNDSLPQISSSPRRPPREIQTRPNHYFRSLRRSNRHKRIALPNTKSNSRESWCRYHTATSTIGGHRYFRRRAYRMLCCICGFG